MTDFYFVAYMVLTDNGSLETHGDSIMEIGTRSYEALTDDIRQQLSDRHENKTIVLTALNRVS